MKKIILFILIPIFLLICGGTLVYRDLHSYADTPAAVNSPQVIINIPPGQSFKSTSRVLRKNAVIKSPFRFNLLARLKGDDKRLKAGEYLLSGRMSPNRILTILVKGTVRQHKITVPEGYNIKQIAALVQQAGLATAADFIKIATDAALAHDRGIPASTFEGYLFPDTYHFPKGVSCQKIIATMVKRFWSVFSPRWKKRAQSLGMSVHQVVTLASIIEKETGAAAERPLISSVFHNRLKKGMRLESDPTVIYGIKNFDGNLTRRHLATRTPYNTYKIKGLPAGPIANPGFASLQAALYPAPSAYLYFVARKNGTHQFSTNLKDHNRAVRKYQLHR